MLKRMKHNQVDFTVDGVPGKYSIDFKDDAASKKQHLQNASVYIKDYIQKEWLRCGSPWIAHQTC